MAKAVLDYRLTGVAQDPHELFKCLSAIFDSSEERGRAAAQSYRTVAQQASKEYFRYTEPAIRFGEPAARSTPAVAAPPWLQKAIAELPYVWPETDNPSWPAHTPWSDTFVETDYAWNPTHGVVTADKAEGLAEADREIGERLVGPSVDSVTELASPTKPRRTSKSIRRRRIAEDAAAMAQHAQETKPAPEPETGVSPKEFSAMCAELSETLPPIVRNPGITTATGTIPIFIGVSPDLYAIATNRGRRRAIDSGQHGEFNLSKSGYAPEIVE